MKQNDYSIKKARKKKPQLTIQTLNLIKKTSTMQQSKSGSIHFDDYDWKVGVTGIRAIGKKKKSKRKYEDFDYSQLTIMQDLGRGGQSEVKLCKYKDRGLHAVKIFFLDGRSHEYSNERNEIDLLQVSDHKFIVRMEQAFTRDQRICILMDYMNCGSLSEIIQRANRGIRNMSVLSQITSQILEALVYLHGEKYVIHCDIKPSNFLVSTKGFVKLTDFGLARRMGKELDPSLGTKKYKSPQCLEFKRCTEKCDIWSLGMTIAELWKGEFPLEINEGGVCELGEQTAVKKTPFEKCITMGGSEFLKREDYPPELFEFLRSCMIKDDTERPNAEQLLKQPFITKYKLSDFDRKRTIGDWAKQFQIRIRYQYPNNQQNHYHNSIENMNYVDGDEDEEEEEEEISSVVPKIGDVVHLALSGGPSPFVAKKKKKRKKKSSHPYILTPPPSTSSGPGSSIPDEDCFDDEDDEKDLPIVKMIDSVEQIKTM